MIYSIQEIKNNVQSCASAIEIARDIKRFKSTGYWTEVPNWVTLICSQYPVYIQCGDKAVLDIGYEIIAETYEKAYNFLSSFLLDKF